MSNDQYQNKYNEILKDLKEEKMNWDFEDFLQKADGKSTDAKIISIHKKTSFPKWFWMAASIIVIFGIGFILNYNHQTGNRAKLVENEVLKQKSDFIKENHEVQQQVAVNNPDSIAGAKKDSIFQNTDFAEKDVLDEILPKRGRMKKESRPRYVSNSPVAIDSTGYKDSYVIVNGKRIDNMEEAINVTKYSFQVVANNVHQTLSQPKVMDNVDY